MAKTTAVRTSLVALAAALAAAPAALGGSDRHRVRRRLDDQPVPDPEPRQGDGHARELEAGEARLRPLRRHHAGSNPSRAPRLRTDRGLPGLPGLRDVCGLDGDDHHACQRAGPRGAPGDGPGVHRHQQLARGRRHERGHRRGAGRVHDHDPVRDRRPDALPRRREAAIRSSSSRPGLLRRRCRRPRSRARRRSARR